MMERFYGVKGLDGAYSGKFYIPNTNTSFYSCNIKEWEGFFFWVEKQYQGTTVSWPTLNGVELEFSEEG